MRKQKTVVISAEGRDKGKHFLITEMPAMQAESWALRALMLMARSGVDLPENALNGGMAAIASVGIRALASLAWSDAQMLLNEMLECVQIIPDPRAPQVVRPLVGQDDVEEVVTLLTLRSEVLELHMGFSLAARLSGIPGTAAAPLDSPQ